ncbi:MAG: hypothetical protein HXX17_08055 [Geobacteraceae bacterium]|nr:hypothetical protein [Geobacteraceae bacterium]
MNYADFEKAWTKRRGAASTTKAMFNSALVMRKNAANGDFEFLRKEVKYEKDPVTHHWKKLPVVEKHWATVTPESIVTFHYTDGTGDNQAKNLVNKLAGISLYSNSSRFAMYEHKLRVSVRWRSGEPPVTYPFGPGFKFDINNRKVLWCPDDVKKVTNKEASKPIIKYVQDVMKVMEVMNRIGAFDADPKAPKESWYNRRKKLDTANVFDMTEDTMALLAEYAYIEAKAITNKVSTYNGTWVKNAQGQDHYVRIDRSEAECAALYWTKLKKNAAERLRAYLKTTHGGYDVVKVNE